MSSMCLWNVVVVIFIKVKYDILTIFNPVAFVSQYLLKKKN